MRLTHLFAVLAPISFATAWVACSSDDPTSNPGGSDASVGSDTGSSSGSSSSSSSSSGGGGDSGSGDGGSDARPDGCPTGTTDFDAGDTCAGFGAKAPCDSRCGQPYGYVCTGGGPANLKGCLQVSTSSFGNTYCCPDLACVRVPFRDSKCLALARPALYHCLADDDGGLLAKPDPGCTEVVGDPDLPPVQARYYCCAK